MHVLRVCRIAQDALEIQRGAAAAALDRAASSEQQLRSSSGGPAAAVLRAELDAAVKAVGEQRARAEEAVQRAQLAEDELTFFNAMRGASASAHSNGSNGSSRHSLSPRRRTVSDGEGAIAAGSGAVGGRLRPQSAASIRSRSSDVRAHMHEPLPLVTERSASAPEHDIPLLEAEVHFWLLAINTVTVWQCVHTDLTMNRSYMNINT